MRRSLRVSLILAASAAVGAWLALGMLMPREGVRVPRWAAPISGLPANARNVTYYLLPPCSYYEFDTDEAGFEEWAASWRLAWKFRREGPQAIVVWDHAAGRRGEVQVSDGVYYGWSEGDAVWALTYDRVTGRANCSGNYR